MKTCSVCGSPVSGGRCTRCGMPYYDDDGIRYHLNEPARVHEAHSPGNRVFSQYMESRYQKKPSKAKAQVYGKKPQTSRTTLIMIIIFLLYLFASLIRDI